MVLDFSKVTEVPSRKENLEILEKNQCSTVHSVHHRSENGQDMAIAGKLMLIGHKLPPTHACPQSPGFGLSTVGQAAFLHQLWLVRRRRGLSGPWACGQKKPAILVIS